jgi:hypothetical protein
VVVHNLDLECISITPDETNTPLVVDADAVLPFALAPQSLQPIARRRSQIAQLRSAIQLPQFAPRHMLDRSKLSARTSLVKLFRLVAFEGLDHLYASVQSGVFRRTVCSLTFSSAKPSNLIVFCCAFNVKQ